MSLLHNRAQNEITKMGYTIISRTKGHIKNIGTDSGKEKNPLWLVRDNNNCETIFMFCEPESIVQLCKDSYSRIEDYERDSNNGIKITWHILTNGYVMGSGCMLFMHQVIMNCYGNGRGTGNISVDHIDRNPLNNRLENLRIATREEQQLNSKGVLDGTKRERQHQARSLPEGISQNDLPKYVTYNVNVWDKEQNKSRDYFRIEGHPLLAPKIWESSKSMLVAIHDKLKVTIDTLEKLNNGILPEYQKSMPTHVYITGSSGRYHLVYDNRKTKQTKRMLIEDVNFEPNNEEQKNKQLYIFNHHIERMYGQSIFSDDFQYIGEPFEIKSKILLPRNTCILNERGRTILLFQKKMGDVKITARINLEQYYESHDETPEINEEINKKLKELNILIIQKYGAEHAICDVPDVIPDKAKRELPMYVRIKTIENGDLYIVFDKKNGNDRIATTIKLRQNYDLNSELSKLNDKIIELYGDAHKLDLTGFEPNQHVVSIPENIYVNSTSKRPYVIKLNKNNTSTMVLPERYDINTELERMNADSTLDTEHCIDHYKTIYDEWKPDNISIINKDGKSVLLYQKRTKEYKHSITVTLPTEQFNINLQLIKMNSKIVEKYGKEFGILQTA